MLTNKSNGQLTAQINVDDHKKSGFDLSNNVLGTGKIGRIIPTRALHVMPNDTIKADSKVAVQFEPLAVPILANMEVKQEHFYVPYNIVWKNWDKFISGGEKMDYKGVVPNVDMQTIVRTINNVFYSDASNMTALHIPIIKRQGDSYFDSTFNLDTSRLPWSTALDYDDSSVYYSVLRALDFVGDKFSIKDLLKPCYESLKVIDSIEYNDESLFGLVGTNNIDVIHDYVATQLNGNKYVSFIEHALFEYAKVNSGVVLPTNKGMEYLAALYEFYKPFYGIGSNIDYLNMARITFADFVYLCLMAISDYYVLAGETSTTYDVYPSFQRATLLPMSILNLRANYNVWFNNYRDILLESDAFEPADTDVISADELFVLLVPRQRCWEKDAFTTALDNPGTGNVGVPINAIYENKGLESADGLSSLLPNVYQYLKVNNTLGKDFSISNPSDIMGLYNDMLNNQRNIVEVNIGDDTWRVPTSYLSGISPIIDVQQANATSPGFSLYALDAAQRAQKWLQKALFFGNRISDFYYMHFGVRFLDARLRLPELLTSSSELVKLDVVMNNTNITTEANGEIYQSIAGDRAAYASAYDNGNSFERYCEEHGVIMSYLTIMPQVTYAYGMNRDYSRLDQFDFAFSEFATLGMDAVYDSEITSISVDLPNSGNDVKVFGYQGKYYDYKAKHSEEHGELLDSQDMYTFARKFNMYDSNGRPKLNYEFVHCFPDLDMFVVDSTLSDYFRYDIRHSTAAERNLPSQSIYI